MAFFQISIRKSYVGYRWVNAYLVSANDLATAAGGIPALVNMEQALHASTVLFEQARCAAWRTENPNDFVTEALSGTGTRVISATNMAAPFVGFHVRLNASTGRPGKKIYRYCLSNDEFYGLGDSSVLNLATITEEAFQTALDAVITNLDTVNVTLEMGDPEGVAGSRSVGALVMAGVVQLDVHHGWYNRQVGG